jgi:hypothetical protein
MDNREQFLIREHAMAARHYKWAVDELQRQLTNREDVTLFRLRVVTPAREECQRSFAAWLTEYRSGLI